jgi:hypothetical protein
MTHQQCDAHTDARRRRWRRRRRRRRRRIFNIGPVLVLSNPSG